MSGVKRVLVVDDVYLNQILLTKFLEKHGYQFDSAQNGIEALEKIGNEQFDLILMDLQMPVMDGYETIERIRKECLPPVSSIPIIGISASVFNDELQRCLRAGANDFVAKPYEPEDLYNKITSYLKPVQEDRVEDKSLPDCSEIKESLTDMSYLQQFASGDETFVTEMITFFVDQAPAIIEQMNKAREANDMEEVYQLAHKFAPQLTFMGIKSIIPDVERIEVIAKKRENIEELSGLLMKVTRISNDAIIELRKYLNR